jgi:hypothetical protein
MLTGVRGSRTVSPYRRRTKQLSARMFYAHIFGDQPEIRYREPPIIPQSIENIMFNRGSDGLPESAKTKQNGLWAGIFDYESINLPYAVDRASLSTGRKNGFLR